MTLIDIVLLVGLGLAGYKGYQKGLWIGLISILSFLVALVLGFLLLQRGVDLLSNHIDGFHGFLPYLSFILIFALVAFLVNLLGKFVKKTIDFTLLGSVDNLAGAVVGVVKWSIGLSLLLWLTGNLGIELPGQENSFMYKWMQPIAPVVIDAVSAYIPFLKSLFQEIKELLGPDNG